MLPSESLPMPSCWRNLLGEAGRGVFARRSTLRLFLVLRPGWCWPSAVPWWRWPRRRDRRAVAAGRLVFCRAAWDADALGLAVARLIVKYLTDPGAPVVVAIDGTFFQRWGKKVFQARWAYDGSAQGGRSSRSGTRG